MKKRKFGIKQLLPRKNSRYDQGYYDIYNPVKYVGKRPIIYRSSWEKLFMSWCENNKQVKQWGSEVTAIPYWDAQCIATPAAWSPPLPSSFPP